MDYKEIILRCLNSLQFKEEYFFQEYSCDEDSLESFDQFQFESINSVVLRKIYLSFTKTDAYDFKKNKFSCIIFKQVEAGSPSLYIKKYLLLEHNSDEAVMSLNFYEGDFEQKLKSFFDFFENLLNEPILSKILSGELWTDKYDYTMAELTGK